jgi:hypothetical protein
MPSAYSRLELARPVKRPLDRCGIGGVAGGGYVGIVDGAAMSGIIATPAAAWQVHFRTGMQIASHRA